MTRQQFRLLVIANQLLLFAGYVVRDLTDVYLPPELQQYFVTSGSVMDGMEAGVFFSEQNVYVLWVIIDIVGLVGAVGLCLGRRWGRTFYLTCYVATLFAGLLTPFYVSSSWPSFLFLLYGTTEGMILALAYFSHLRRMFERDEREEEEEEEEEENASGRSRRLGLNLPPAFNRATFKRPTHGFNLSP